MVRHTIRLRCLEAACGEICKMKIHIASVALLATAVAARADLPWVMETRVRAPGESESLQSNRTIFTEEGKVYDFLVGPGPESIAILDVPKLEFVVLDPMKRLRCRVASEQLLSYIAAMEQKARQRGGLPGIAASPASFDIGLHKNRAGVILRDAKQQPTLQYEVEAEKEPALGMASDYALFADWSARLNALHHPQSLPPGVRIRLNRELSRENWIPVTVTRQIRTAERTDAVTSHHEVRSTLTADDLSQMHDADAMHREFNEVSVHQFFR